MRIAVIGAGHVGGTLGRQWAERGHHDVWFGVRDPSRGAAAVQGGDALPAGVRVVGVAEAADGADVVVLATPWAAVPDALREIGDDALAGAVLVDATNPVGAGLTLDVGPRGESGAERIQALAPTARVVKAFNTTGAENMADPVYGGEPTAMFYAGDDAEAKSAVRLLVTALGFDPVDAGPLARARELEHLALLWISLAFGGMGRGIAFKLARR